MTGSTLFEGIGLDNLKNQQKHFDKVVKKINVDQNFSEETMKRINHGTASEIPAIATLTGKIIPAYYPSLSYIEEGAHVVHKDGNPFILVSPDGSLSKMETDTLPIPVLGCEFKCPYPADYKMPVHYEVPKRYVRLN